MLLFWTSSGSVFAPLLYLVVIISGAISLGRMILRASDWQIATWKGGNNRLTLKFISQTVHYACSDVRWGEYFGTGLYSMMSLSWEFLCEMNFNLKVFTQREEAKNCSLLYLIWKVRGKIILHHYRSISQIQLSFHFTFCSAKQTYLIFILFFPENHCNGFVWAAVTGNQTHYISQDKVNAKMILIIYGYCTLHGQKYWANNTLYLQELPWKPMPWSSWHTVLVLILMPEEVWNSAVAPSPACWQLSCIMRLSAQHPCSVTLCGLPLPGWVAVVSKYFYFAIIPLTNDCGISRREKKITKCIVIMVTS